MTAALLLTTYQLDDAVADARFLGKLMDAREEVIFSGIYTGFLLDIVGMKYVEI